MELPLQLERELCMEKSSKGMSTILACCNDCILSILRLLCALGVVVMVQWIPFLTALCVFDTFDSRPVSPICIL